MIHLSWIHILIILAVLCFFGGGYYHWRQPVTPVDPNASPRPAYYSYATWSPFGLILLIILILFLTGRLH